MSNRVRRRNELNKGVEALRFDDVAFINIVTNNKTLYGVMGPYEVDIDVKSVVVGSGVLPVDDAGNTLDVFGGTEAQNKTIIAQFNPDNGNGGFSAQVPTSRAITGNSRVLAGTPVLVKLVLPGDNSVTPADLTVRMGYDIVIHEPYAKSTTYGGYDDSQ